MGKISQIEYNGTNYDICDSSATNKIDTHIADTDIHVTTEEKTAIANISEIESDIERLETAIPTKVSQLTNDSGFKTEVTEDDVIDALGYLPAETDTQYQIVRNYEGTENATVLSLEPINGISTYASEGTPAVDGDISGAMFKYFKTSDGTYYYPVLAEEAKAIAEGYTIPINKGGTGATIAADALQNLGITATAAELNYCDGVTSNIQTQINDINTTIDSLNDFFGAGTSIPSGADLNTYTTVGKYYVGSTSLAATMVNAPVTNTNYTMFVIKRTTGSSITQIIVTLANTIYMRSATANGSLSKWEKCATSSDLTSHNSSTSAHADIREAITTAKSEANDYTDGKISALLDGASDTTLDSIKELSDAIKENDTAIEALNSIAATKAPASDLDALEETVGGVQTNVTNLQTQINTLLERIAELEIALANKQDKINTFGDLSSGSTVVNVAEEGA